MTHKQWFNNVLHLHPVHEEGAKLLLKAWLHKETVPIPHKLVNV